MIGSCGKAAQSVRGARQNLLMNENEVNKKFYIDARREMKKICRKKKRIYMEN